MGRGLPIPQPFFTIGHSNRTLPEFADLLRASDIRVVADVRKIPRSLANPQFAQGVLPASLAEFQIGYRHFPELGGRRGRSGAPDPSQNAFWRVKSFRNYADYALTDAFSSGLTELRRLGREQRVAIMCAEVVWWRCHRRIIADYLMAAGETVLHIMGPGRVDPAHPSPGARARPDGKILYPEAS